jgi:hypothetical protein
MLALGYFVTALVIGVAAFLSAFAARRRFPKKLPEFRWEELDAGEPAGIGVNVLRDQASFSERLGKMKFGTSIYQQIIKRY